MQNKLKKVISIIVILIMILTLYLGTMSISYAEIAEPESNQYIEYRATDIKKVNGRNQLKVEVWVHHLNFTGFDLKVGYDKTELTPSTPTTNETINLLSTSLFGKDPGNVVFVNDFDKDLEVMNVTDTAGQFRYVYSIVSIENRQEFEYMTTDETYGTYISIPEETQIAYMTFALDNTMAQTDNISLQSNTVTPMTGIELLVSGNANLNMQSETLFRYTVSAQTGTLTGSVDTLTQTQETTGKSKAILRVYNQDTINSAMNLTEIENEYSKTYSDDLHSRLLELGTIKVVETEDNGKFEIPLRPGNYLVLIDKPGYMDDIFKNIEIKSMEIVNLGMRTLQPGDVDKDGLVDISDITFETKANGSQEGDEIYQDYLDIDNDGIVDITDFTFTVKNNYLTRTIVDMTGRTNI